MKTILLVGILGIVFLSGCSNQPIQESSSTEMTSESLSTAPSTTESEETEEITVLAENLTIPWAIEKNGETFYVSERGGTIAKITDGKVERQKVDLAEPLSDAAEAGFMGFVLSEDFDESQTAYGYYTYENSATFSRVIQLKLEENQWKETNVLLDQIPAGSFHHGGRLKIGPDKKLYATVGDALDEERAQEETSLTGKILRMNLDGSIPEDNPFADSYVYSYGHRNPQGLAWGEDGQIYASEHGDSANDEINEIEAGKNYGWPVIQGNQTQTGMRKPLFTSGSDQTWAPSGMAYHEDNLYVAALRGTAVLEVNSPGKKVTERLTEYGRIRDIYIMEDQLYFVTNNSDGRGTPNENDDRLVQVPLTRLATE
ncbi:PQQ-dependent sugar dehydrogenase [Enterococcus songbeiensis]|uniref:PQQ-dependent sugar dehydrogenase n=1 Tax=Enterococcus songbeiensis TaxID=2559927 RepID=UPI0010F99116|nr:PQQ-dependent sugar dehydrogenase [Enterococcus songbeiensis]